MWWVPIQLLLQILRWLNGKLKSLVRFIVDVYVLSQLNPQLRNFWLVRAWLVGKCVLEALSDDLDLLVLLHLNHSNFLLQLLQFFFLLLLLPHDSCVCINPLISWFYTFLKFGNLPQIRESFTLVVILRPFKLTDPPLDLLRLVVNLYGKVLIRLNLPWFNFWKAFNYMFHARFKVGLVNVHDLLKGFHVWLWLEGRITWVLQLNIEDGRELVIEAIIMMNFTGWLQLGLTMTGDS